MSVILTAAGSFVYAIIQNQPYSARQLSQSSECFAYDRLLVLRIADFSVPELCLR